MFLKIKVMKLMGFQLSHNNKLMENRKETY
jgi:hypothetical protein